MRISRITSNYSQISTPSVKVSGPLSYEIKSYLENYSQENFSHHKGYEENSNKPTKLLDHQALFNFGTDEEEYVSRLYTDEKELIDGVKDMLSNKTTYDLIDIFDRLIQEDKLRFGTHDENSSGFISFDSNDVKNSDIFITTDQSLLGVATTVVHELTHYKDLNNIALQSVQNISGYDLEVNAFGKAYSFLKNNYHLEDSSYKSLSKLAKDVYKSAYSVKEQNYISLEAKTHMLNLLEDIGYERDHLLYIRLISNKDIDLAKELFSTSQLNSIIFRSKILNQDIKLS